MAKEKMIDAEVKEIPPRKEDTPVEPKAPVMGEVSPVTKAVKDTLRAVGETGEAIVGALQNRDNVVMVRIHKEYVFEGPNGEVSLLDLFEGRRQLIVYHFMFAPGVDGWPEAGCPGCSMVIDQICQLAHLHARDTSFAAVSRAPIAKIETYRTRIKDKLKVKDTSELLKLAISWRHNQ